jgi:hypothetical protein
VKAVSLNAKQNREVLHPSAPSAIPVGNYCCAALAATQSVVVKMNSKRRPRLKAKKTKAVLIESAPESSIVKDKAKP